MSKRSANFVRADREPARQPVHLPVHVVAALWSEARPLIDHFGLEAADPGAPFRIFEGNGVALVVSGVGKVASAAAAGYLFARHGAGRDRPWINVGVGGHRDLASGSAVVAHKVVDRATGRAWYPPLVFEPALPTATVCTVDDVERDYETEMVYEMEAAGFYSAAARFATAELVHVVKIISDGPDHLPDGLTARRVTELVSAAVEPVAGLVDSTRDLARDLESVRPRVDTAPWLERWHFTVTQRRRLERLLARLRIVDPAFSDADGALARAAELRDAADVLARLEEDLRLALVG